MNEDLAQVQAMNGHLEQVLAHALEVRARVRVLIGHVEYRERRGFSRAANDMVREAMAELQAAVARLDETIKVRRA